MNKLYFPDRTELDMSANAIALFGEEQFSIFKGKLDDLEAIAAKLSSDYLKLPSSVTQNQIENVVKNTYQLTVDMFDEKIRRGSSLIAEERAIYDLCKSELSKYHQTEVEEPVESILGFLFNAIELARNCIDEIKNWFGFNSDDDKAGLVIVEVGNRVLPDYYSNLKVFFIAIKDFFSPIFAPSILGLADAQMECALRYQQDLPISKAVASDMLNIADYAYSGHSEKKSGEFSKLDKSELPSNIRVLYNEQNGLLKSSRGLQAWLGKKDNDIVVSFSGTDIKNFDMLYADVAQLSAPSVLYLKAVGLLKIILDKFPNKNIFVTGHSLGGGLTQFSLSANQPTGAPRLNGFAYNPAGLSTISVKSLGSSNLNSAKSKVKVFMTTQDIVSCFGGKIGCLVTLPKSSKNGHGMADLKECMTKYLSTMQLEELTNITVKARNHNEDDFMPYTKKLSLSYSNTIYPIFNPNATSSSSSFLDIKISYELFRALEFKATLADYCLGVYNKYNGTAHTVINRLLLTSDNDNIITTESTGNIHSSLMFGKFGLGLKDFALIVRDAFAENLSLATNKRKNFELTFANIINPMAYDKAAWIRGFWLEYRYDLQNAFNQYKDFEDEFDQWLIKVTSDRIDLYNATYKGVAPSTKDKKDFATELEHITMDSTSSLFKRMNGIGLINRAQLSSFQSSTADYCKRVLATY